MQEAIDKLFQSGSEAKSLIASAVTAKGVQTPADATWKEIEDNISKIETGGTPKDTYNISLSVFPEGFGTVSGAGVASKDMIVQVSAESNEGYGFSEWEEDGKSVSILNPYQFKVESDRNLVAKFLEFEWWSPHMTSNNMPVPYAASASSTFRGVTILYDPWKAFDGNISSVDNAWVADRNSAAANANWIKLNFGSVVQIRGIRIFPRATIAYQSPKQATIQVSSDGNSWETMGEFTNATFYEGAPNTYLFDRTVSCQYF